MVGLQPFHPADWYTPQHSNTVISNLLSNLSLSKSSDAMYELVGEIVDMLYEANDD